ncbi:Acidic phosphoprotein precursor PCEMA1, putative [Plasmodium chabaudi adami]|uniref:Acidic phosphoprotein PCEMA1, putative n=1 Tax=Plasmodium chabaudi adami TaxID=5826 RepID=A0A1C6WNS6_PLACE|nr:Acidic phosphoprotein precursor PCEMA1, putative [Plasmodium chabaudi adami]
MNKFYIQIVLFLLSIFAYANNETLATELVPGQATKTRSRYATSEEIYQQNKHLLRTCQNNIKAVNLMKDVVKHLEYHATSKDGYEVYVQNPNDNISYYVKKFDDQTDILKINLNIYSSNQYNDMVNRLWDPNGPKIFNKGTVKIFHVYNPNLVLIRQICETDSKHYRKYFYALVSKAEISKDKTIIAMTSVYVQDRNPSSKEHKNPIIENVDSFKGFINPKYYIMSEEYKQIYVNLAGYLIEKKGDDLEITYIESIDGHSSI